MEKVEPDAFRKALYNAKDLARLIQSSHSPSVSPQALIPAKRIFHSISKDQLVEFISQPRVLDLLDQHEQLLQMLLDHQCSPLRAEGPNKKMALQ